MTYLKFLSFIFGLLLLSSNAQATGQERLFNSYIQNNQFYTNQLEVKSKRIFNLIHAECNEQASYIRLKPRVVIPYRFTLPDLQDLNDVDFNTIHPSFGQWVERARINACGQQATINTLVVAFDTLSMPTMYPLLNGQTQISIQYQSIAENIVANEIQVNTNCSEKGVVVDTNLIGYRSSENNQLIPENDNAGWFEKWTVLACKKTHNVNLAVIPDPRTQYQYIAELDKSSQDISE